MKKLGSLVTALLASQAAGCVIENDGFGSEAAAINAQWSFRDVTNNATTQCPAGFDTVALNSQPIDFDGRATGPVIIDLFDCFDFHGTSAPLPPDIYQSWIEVRNTVNNSLYAESLSAIVDVIDSDKTIDITILNDGGYFQLAWDLIGADSNQRLECSDVSGLDGIEVISTSVSSPDKSETDQFTCSDHAGVTGGFLQGAYTISIDAFDNGRAIGEPVNVSEKVIRDRNRVTDLGHVDIPVAGR